MKSQKKFIVDNYLPPVEPDKKILCVFSGGLDSTILLYLLKETYPKIDIIALIFNYNQRHKYEIQCAEKTCSKLGIEKIIVDMSWFGNIIKNGTSLVADSNIDVPKIQEVLGDPQPATYIPFRNMLFLSFALSIAEANNYSDIFIGLQAHDLYQYWDTTPDFLLAIDEVAKLNRKNRIKIRAPFVALSKKDEIIIGQELKVPFEDTWSCYNGPNENNQACAKCPTCSERIKNFIDAGIKDPIKYVKKIPWEKTHA